MDTAKVKITGHVHKYNNHIHQSTSLLDDTTLIFHSRLFPLMFPVSSTLLKCLHSISTEKSPNHLMQVLSNAPLHPPTHTHPKGGNYTICKVRKNSIERYPHASREKEDHLITMQSEINARKESQYSCVWFHILI